MEGTESDTPKGQSLHIHADAKVIRCFTEGYRTDKEFAHILTRTRDEPPDERKFCAYRIADNGLLYFEDADTRVCLCIPSTEREAILKEVHDGAHESAHAGWEQTLATLRERFYWPRMRLDVTEYVRTCKAVNELTHGSLGLVSHGSESRNQ